MLRYPPISPDLIHIGRVRVRWYGVMYILGFVIARQILRRLCRKNFLRMAVDRVDDMLVALFVGMLIGARLLYVAVYLDPGADFRWYYTPFAVWEGGLAFHGGLAGMLLALWWFGRRFGVRFWNLADSLALAGPPGIALGRIGNFINAELWGRETDVPWAIRFPIRDFEGRVLEWTTPRHPSQLYEAIAEGLLTLAFVWLVKQKAKYQGFIMGAGMCWYASARFVIEFFREKDEQMSYYFGWMTMGQLLCVIMLLIGISICTYAVRTGVPVDAPGPGEPVKAKASSAPESGSSD